MATTFGERLQQARQKKGMTKAELSKLTNISVRSLQNYESGRRYPNNLEIAGRLASALDVSTQYLMGEEGQYIADARQRGGARDAQAVRALVEDISGCFAGGELPDEDLDAMMKALTDAYFIAKEKNKVFAGNKKKTSAASEE